MSELEPCPFCGEAEKIRYSWIRDGHTVSCRSCGGSSGAGFNGPGDPGGRNAAARLWNTRPPPDKSAVDEARKVVDAIYAEWDASGACGPPIMRKHIAAALAAREAGVLEKLDNEVTESIRILEQNDKGERRWLNDTEKAVVFALERVRLSIRALRGREEKESPKVRKVE